MCIKLISIRLNTKIYLPDNLLHNTVCPPLDRMRYHEASYLIKVIQNYRKKINEKNVCKNNNFIIFNENDEFDVHPLFGNILQIQNLYYKFIQDDQVFVCASFRNLYLLFLIRKIDRRLMIDYPQIPNSYQTYHRHSMKSIPYGRVDLTQCNHLCRSSYHIYSTFLYVPLIVQIHDERWREKDEFFGLEKQW